MFTLQAGKLSKLLDHGDKPEIVQILQSVFGACGQDLEHRGTIKVTERFKALSSGPRPAATG